ncbi:MAG: geranylgeranylglycerol-phosphate geranylgeranyltransferase, partial [Chloroflexota bacterium]
YVSQTGAWGQIGLAALSTVLISASANAWNDYLDIEIDRVNQPTRPLPAGLITPNQAMLFSLILSALAILFAILINRVALTIVVVSIVLLYLYSWRLKSTVLIGNVVVATISGLSAYFGGIAAGNPQPAIWLSIIIFIGILGREILKTLADYEGDLEYHCRTIATVWGRRPAKWLSSLILGLMLVAMFMPFFAQVYRPVYALIVAVGVLPVVLYIIIMQLTKENSGPQYESLSQLMKYDFLIWFVAVWFGLPA